MILVLAGTQDGREIAGTLSQMGYLVLASVTSDYGRQLASHEGIEINAEPLDALELSALIRRKGITCVVDASHPYAQNASVNAMKACDETNVRYLRYERPVSKLPEYDKLHVVYSYQEAAKLAATVGKVVFLTTGSRALRIFKTEQALQNVRLIARVLPDPKVIQECFALGFTPRDIIAMQGPFSHELNKAMFSHYGAEVIVTKNSGQIGGSDYKFTAAMELGLELVVIDRPAVKYTNIVHSEEELKRYFEEEKQCSL